MPPPIRAIVPMIHVTDVEQSIDFYRLLGFEIGNRVPDEGPLHWVWLSSKQADNWKREANLMLTRSCRPIEADSQDVLFYLYAADMRELHRDLAARGVLVSEICFPEYLPEGEFRVTDPDGYTFMIAQSTAETP